MESASSVITSKFQTTIPKAIRENLKLTVSDTLNWEIRDDKIVVSASKRRFLRYRNAVKIGQGDTQSDIERARAMMVEKYQ
jgi:AbrB family looped-hinge helix DNA binding protein